jgi:hypothetical protein
VVPWHSATEDTLASSCNLAQACTSANITPPCDWDTGNIDSVLEFSVCHYAAVAPASYSFACRLHELFGMRGTFTVVQPIELRVELNVLEEPELTWNAGGVGPWNVWRDTTGAMPGPTNLTVGGTSSRTLTDTTAGDIAYYLALELTTGCGNGVREGTELCDGGDLGGANCLTQGFDGGTLSCTGTCDAFDTSECTICGDTVCEPSGGEDCLSCTDCNGEQGGNPGNRFCCGDGDGENPVDCNDARCTGGGNTCVE